MRVKFKCSSCEHDQLEEILTDVVVATTVVEVEPDGELEYAGLPENAGGVVDRYQCKNCRRSIREFYSGVPVDTPEGLFEWLQRQ